MPRRWVAADMDRTAPSAAALVAPDVRYTTSFVAALHEGFGSGSRPPITSERTHEIELDFAGHIGVLTEQTGTVTLPNGEVVPKVPFSLHWLVEGDEFIWQASFRHQLNDWLRFCEGGHIGYGIRPSRRGQGYGKLILRLTLDEARRRGLVEVLITCDDTNLASARIIEANGGVLYEKGVVPGIAVPVRRYRIAL